MEIRYNQVVVVFKNNGKGSSGIVEDLEAQTSAPSWGGKWTPGMHDDDHSEESQRLWSGSSAPMDKARVLVERDIRTLNNAVLCLQRQLFLASDMQNLGVFFGKFRDWLKEDSPAR